MINRRLGLFMVIILLLQIVTAACSSKPDSVCVVLDTGTENDNGFNQYSLKGARTAAAELGLSFAHAPSFSERDYAPNIDQFITEGCDLIITVGFLMGEATAAAARANPKVSFAIVDVAYFPGEGCDAAVADCYTAEGGLDNVTSLMFAEDEVGYLAGTLAGCMSETGVIGSVAGMEIPPVVRFVTVYQNGARSQNPGIQTLNVYIPNFNDPASGKLAGDDQLSKGADILFGVGGNTGNGALLAAHEAGMLAIGVDVDQYNTFTEVASSLLTSATKNIDVATYNAVMSFAAGELAPGIQLSTVANGGVGLAPFHNLDSRVPDACRQAVQAAEAGLTDGSIDPMP